MRDTDNRRFPFGGHRREGREHGPHLGIPMRIDMPQVGHDGVDHDQRDLPQVLGQVAQPLDVRGEVKGPRGRGPVLVRLAHGVQDIDAIEIRARSL